MKKLHIERDNFAYLTIALTVFMLIGSLTHEFADIQLNGRILEIALVLTLVTGVWSVRNERQLFAAGIGFTVAVLLVSVAGFFSTRRA